MSVRTIIQEDLESLADELIDRCPTGFLSEIKISWTCGIAIRGPEGGSLVTPRAIIQVSNQEGRAFETAFQLAKNARIPFSSPVSAPTTAEAI